MKTNQIIVTALENITVRDEDNVRLSYDEKAMKDLQTSIKRDGLLQPPTIRAAKPEDKSSTPYILVAGFRRFRVLKTLEFNESAFTLIEADRKGAAFANLVENINRESLTAYEMAHGFKRMRDEHGMTLDELSRQLKGESLDGKGKSKANIGNLVRLVENLHPSILEAWRDRHEKATTFNLLKIVALDPDAQWSAWLEMCGVSVDSDDADNDSDDDSDDSSNKEETEKPKKPSMRRADDVLLAIGIVRQAVKDEQITEEDGKTIVATLQWVLKKRVNLPGVKAEKKSAE